jgi:thiol-disulfide isomerase/thioredoxin
MRSTRLTVAVFAAAVTLGLAACSATLPTEPGSTLDRARPSASSGAAMPAAFNFTAPTLDGGTFDGTSLYGKATILWFWAPWCASCAADSKYVLAAIPDLPAGVQLIGVPTFSDDAGMHEFADSLGVNALTNIVDGDGAISIAFNLPALPSAAVIYPDGYFVTIPGSLSTESILQIAQKIAP